MAAALRVHFLLSSGVIYSATILVAHGIEPASGWGILIVYCGGTLAGYAHLLRNVTSSFQEIPRPAFDRSMPIKTGLAAICHKSGKWSEDTAVFAPLYQHFRPGRRGYHSIPFVLNVIFAALVGSNLPCEPLRIGSVIVQSMHVGVDPTPYED